MASDLKGFYAKVFPDELTNFLPELARTECLGPTDQPMDQRMDQRMVGRTDGRADGRTDGQTDGPTDRQRLKEMRGNAKER